MRTTRKLKKNGDVKVFLWAAASPSWFSFCFITCSFRFGIWHLCSMLIEPFSPIWPSFINSLRPNKFLIHKGSSIIYPISDRHILNWLVLYNCYNKLYLFVYSLFQLNISMYIGLRLDNSIMILAVYIASIPSIKYHNFQSLILLWYQSN